jgi:triacylglycerol esterase/lipase EstA (alpha/beta hydrolase family)
MLKRPTRRSLVAALTVGAASLAVTASASAALPVTYNSIAAGTALLRSPSSPPPGANDWTCKPTAKHPDPVVLVHATGVNMALNWNALSPLLKNNGYCVFAFNYGMTGLSLGGIIGGLGPMEASGTTMAAFVDQVLAATGASKVDLVGHSQGGLLERYYINLRGGSDKVAKMVAIAPTSHGTTLSGVVTLGATLKKIVPGLANPIYKALSSQSQGLLDQQTISPFVAAMNALPDTVPGIDYTVISSNKDTVSTPWQAQRLIGDRVHNIVVQGQCPLDFVDHVGLAFDSIALRDVLNALDPSTARPIVCKFITPFIGG